MRLPSDTSPFGLERRFPTVDEIGFRELYDKSEYEAETEDGWTLGITRYRPRQQGFPQPLWMQPLLLVHGFSQNRHAWTSGEFVKNLLYFGADIHILELRGHGKSSIRRQREVAKATGRPLPGDLHYGWDVDSYFVHDVPTGIPAVKRQTGRAKIFYCGHSMGGMLGYGYAGQHDDLAGLITIGSAAELGRGLRMLRAPCWAEPMLQRLADAGVGLHNLRSRLGERAMRLRAQLQMRRGQAVVDEAPRDTEASFEMPYVPMEALYQGIDWLMEAAEQGSVWKPASRGFNLLSNPSRSEAERLRWLLRNGGEREPRRVLSQFARWIRHDEMKCYRTGYDFKEGYANIRIPTAIIFGDLDPLATLDSTRRVYHDAQSQYLLWRPVKGNSHIELTMGHDIRQICYDIKNLMEYACAREQRPPSLPRIR